jgi:hypothetical protein
MNGWRDRCDYRTMSNALLIEEARYTPNPELAIVLAERLRETEREMAREMEHAFL